MEVVVCDNGTGFLKVGNYKNQFPEVVVPCVIGRPNKRMETYDEDIEDYFVADEALKYQHFLNLSRPLENGIVEDWEGMLKIWEHVFFNTLDVDFDNTRILITEAPFNPHSNRVDMAECMLETFGFNAMKVEYEATLSLYARGLVTGVILDSGEGVTHCIPVYGGQIFESAIKRINLAGRAITSNLFKMLNIRGYRFHTSYDFEQVRMIKDECCFASVNLPQDRRLAFETTALDKHFELPDGSWIRVGKERFQALEAFFRPEEIGMDEPGIHEMVFNSIMDCDIHVRKELFKSIILSGGSTLHPGMPERVSKELKLLCSNYKKKNVGGSMLAVKIEDPPYRRWLVYIGGTVYAEILQSKSGGWITKEDLEEEGPDRLFR